MENSNVIIGVIFLVITILLWVIIWIQSLLDERKLFEKICFSIASSICLCVGICMLTASPEKQVLEYLRGNIKVTYEKVYVDSNLIRIDTIIKPKKL